MSAKWKWYCGGETHGRSSGEKEGGKVSRGKGYLPACELEEK